MKDQEAWRRNSQRAQMIQGVFGELSRTRGPRAAILAACDLFGSSGGPSFAREIEIEIAAISSLQSGNATEAELGDLVSHVQNARRPILRACAFSAIAEKPREAFARLRRILDSSDAKGDDNLRRLILVAALESTRSSELEDLGLLLPFAEKEIGKEKAISLIAGSVATFDEALGARFIVEQCARDLRLAGRIVRSIRLPLQVLTIAFEKLKPAEVSEFVSGYTEQLQGANPLLYADLAAVFGPASLAPAVRCQVIAGLLQTGGENALAWLESVLPADRATALSQTYDFMVRQQGGNGSAMKEWLVAASRCPGIDEKVMASAIRNAAHSLPWETVTAYIKLLSPEVRGEVEGNVYFTRVAKLADGDLGAMMAFIQSAPKELQSNLVQIAANSIAVFSPERALKWYSETTDPKEKRALEEAILASPNLSKVPMETRKAWIIERTEDSNYLKSGSAAVNGYIRDLLATDAPSAVELLSNLPESTLRASATKEMARAWSYSDPFSASEWIVKLPPGESRDFALSELTKASRSEPDSAFVNVAGISNQSLRLEAATSVVEWWKSRDPQKIRSLISGSVLPEADKTKLLTILNR